MVSIDDSPNEILEKIFFYLCPYADLANAMKVCKRWREVGKSVLHFRQCRFKAGLEQIDTMTWTKLTPPITEPLLKMNYSCQTNLPSHRFGASLIYYDDVLYMFGGATMQRTTFNDLWTFNLTNKKWNRVLPSTGTYPPPRACAVGIRYHTNLVIYGGFEHQTTSLIWVRSHWLNTAFVYSIPDNRWTNLHLNPKGGCSGNRPATDTTGTALPNSCGHSVCLVQGNRLLLFGGKCEDRRLNSTHLIDLGVGEWSLVEPIVGKLPAARFGHTAAAITQERMVMLGGDVGPNTHANDVWLLQVDSARGDRWWWSPISVPDSSSLPPSLNYLSSVKVPGLDLVLVLGSANPLLEDHMQRLHDTAALEERAVSVLLPPVQRVVAGEDGGAAGLFRAQRRQSAPVAEPIVQDLAVVRPPESISGERSPLPSIRRNSRADRQRRLNALQAEEDRLQAIHRAGGRQALPLPQNQPQQHRHLPASSNMRKRPLCLYTLDVSELLAEDISAASAPSSSSHDAASATNLPSVSWTRINPACQDLGHAPAERFGYPAVIGRQEIFVMGGLVTRGERSKRRFFVDNLLIDPMMQAETDPALFELSGDLFVCAPKILSRNLT